MKLMAYSMFLVTAIIDIKTSTERTLLKSKVRVVILVLSRIDHTITPVSISLKMSVATDTARVRDFFSEEGWDYRIHEIGFL